MAAWYFWLSVFIGMRWCMIVIFPTEFRQKSIWNNEPKKMVFQFSSSLAGKCILWPRFLTFIITGTWFHKFGNASRKVGEFIFIFHWKCIQLHIFEHRVFIVYSLNKMHIYGELSVSCIIHGYDALPVIIETRMSLSVL